MKARERRWARRGTDVAVAVGFGALASSPQPGLWTALLVTAVGIAVGCGRRGLRRGLAGLAVLVTLSLGRAVAVDGQWTHVADELPSALARAGVPWLIAVALRLHTRLRHQADRQLEAQRRQHLADLRERHTAQRLALAESLHDDLGHALSLVALNLGRLEVDSALTPSARESITGARRDLSRAVERLGVSVASLRTGSTPGAPDRESADQLLDRARAAGARISVSALPAPDRLRHFDPETVNRVLRESVTNASRHAPGERITIQATDENDRLRVRVVNAVRNSPPGAGTSGTGLRTLGHHLRARGGHLETRQEAAEFSLVADIPRSPSPAEPGAPTAEPGDPTAEPGDPAAEREGGDRGSRAASRTRRHGRLVLVAATTVVIVGLGTVETLSAVHKHRALLPAQTFAEIDVGDPRAATTTLLPDHELPPRRGETPSDDCHDYAVTANTFDAAAGDVHRICFSGDAVVSVEYVAAETR